MQWVCRGVHGPQYCEEPHAPFKWQGLHCHHKQFFHLCSSNLDLLESGTMATSTLRGNRKYVSKAMFAKVVMKQKDIGWVDYRMHREMKVYCVVWKDKQPAVFLSTHAEPMLPPGVHQFVWQKFGGHWKKVQTGPMHLQYMWNEHGVDTMDQLYGVYSSLIRSHKWLHQIFFYTLDTIVANMWIYSQ